ncbi:winged helix-turn-helix domain-containing protein [Glutamicibacter sp. NPDC087661]|uniref:winged helix-turn-helix domain-containing protein n=2 Tax=unclassified Glutamicibacter TaxID=2627139 RepID=UPI00381637C4
MSNHEPPVTFTTPMLKAIANPLRRQILDALSAMETARAADLAQALGVPANKVSFHLRELAKADMIVEVPELARDRRDRVWKPAARGYTTGKVGERPEDQTGTTMDAYLSQVVHDEQRRLQATLRHAERHYRGEESGEIKAQMQTSNLMLTQDECDELMRRMEEVIPAFREDLKNGKVTSSQPAGDREIWHVMSLFNADSLLNESQEGDQSS